MRGPFAALTAAAATADFVLNSKDVAVTMKTTGDWSLTVDGAPFVTGGQQFGFRTAGGACQLERQFDYLGNDMTEVHGIATAAECCQRCKALQGCHAFTHHSDSPPPPFTDTCFLKTSSAGRQPAKPGQNCTSGVPGSWAPLAPAAPPAEVSGTYALGAYRGLNLTWGVAGAGAAPAPAWQGNVKVYLDTEMVVFQQVFLQAIPGVPTRDNDVLSAWPVFAPGPADRPLNYVTYGGNHLSSATVGRWGDPCAGRYVPCLPTVTPLLDYPY
eukprot:gene5163-5241_t